MVDARMVDARMVDARMVDAQMVDDGDIGHLLQNCAEKE
jgi:hypothetical protein